MWTHQKINIGKKGKIIFDIAPRMHGNKMTDWSNAMNIALNPEELGDLLSNLMMLSEVTSYTHTSLQGVSKVLTIVANYTDGHYTFKLNANDMIMIMIIQKIKKRKVAIIKVIVTNVL